MAEVNALSPGTILKNGTASYKVVRVLGAGGFGITYLVESRVLWQNISLPARFAIKEHFISSLCERQDGTQQVTFSEPVGETVRNSRRAFIREANRLHSLGISHHNIVSINEVFEANNTAYYVMEYLEGETLQQYVARCGALSESETLKLMRPIIDAMALLHSNRITHYDIKPANIILVTTDEGAVRPVLIDFGLSKHYDESGDGTSSLLAQGFTPGYAPVEQYDGLVKFSPQADVYALGATIYYCLTGRKPERASQFDATKLPQTLRGIASERLITVLQHAMAYSANQRLGNAGILYQEIYGCKPNASEETVVLEDKTVKPEPVPRKPKPEPRKSEPEPRKSEPEPSPEPRRLISPWLWIGIVTLIFIGLFFIVYNINHSGGIDAPQRVNTVAVQVDPNSTNEVIDTEVTDKDEGVAVDAIKEEETETVNYRKPQDVTPTDTVIVSKEAISYLDNNKIWTKEGLEKHPSLKGLFDDLNNFRLEKLRNEWAKKLGNSKGFKKIFDHLGSAIAKKRRTKLDGTTFTNGSEITVQSYLVKIDP